MARYHSFPTSTAAPSLKDRGKGLFLFGAAFPAGLGLRWRGRGYHNEEEMGRRENPWLMRSDCRCTYITMEYMLREDAYCDGILMTRDRGVENEITLSSGSGLEDLPSLRDPSIVLLFCNHLNRQLPSCNNIHRLHPVKCRVSIDVQFLEHVMCTSGPFIHSLLSLPPFLIDAFAGAQIAGWLFPAPPGVPCHRPKTPVCRGCFSLTRLMDCLPRHHGKHARPSYLCQLRNRCRLPFRS
ncbi:hypothetical protein B0J13DRAFT_80777 [Dactylonectria estremocensis]|uniref:Uncharacterized protein n=1 Tax=Dactylonectria estremocensis TaxID=1079267 RepID=A0A9P9IZM3_9HYPO|nr:hypothetical protein B0J13DRAFT_80777 [Dactylonectria estremocensis]